jgi:predicted N-acyltransferase
MLKDFSAEDRQILGEFQSHGFRRIPGMPATKLDLSFASFEEYMRTRLGKVFRKNLRRKFKALQRVPPLTMEVVRDASPMIDEIFPLYRQVYERAQMTFDSLNKEYFLALGQEMPDKTRFFVWRQNGRIIAFSQGLIHGRTLYDLGVGFDYSVALRLHLYFVTFRDVIQWCVENGVKTYHAGSLGYDPKLHLKLRLVPQDIYARFKPHWLNHPLQFAMDYFAPIRYEPLLRKFANAREL